MRFMKKLDDRMVESVKNFEKRFERKEDVRQRRKK